MKKIARTIHDHHKDFWNKANTISLLLSMAFLGIALFLEKIADNYVVTLKTPPVSDIFLSNFPTVDMGVFIVQGALVLVVLLIFLFVYKPKYINIGLKSLALFVVTRSFFISLTHLGAYPNQLVFDPDDFGFKIYNLLFNTSNDFFFSGHTGVPYLMALIFWPEKVWRYTLMIISVVFGVSVLLAHIHYSIDVFAAPFITYSIFSISRRIFPKDYKISRNEAA